MVLKLAEVLVLWCLLGYSCAQDPPPACVPDSVRLQGLAVASAGRVEVCVDGEWGTVCSLSQWSLKNAQVVCRQLGYTTAINALPQDSLIVQLHAADEVPIHLIDIVCDGTETGLQNCFHSTDVPTTCSHFTDAAVVCGAAESVVALGDVRLLGDVDDVTGAVEYYDALLGWTGVCADSSHSAAWTTSNAASVVCSQLGYEGGRPFVQSIDDVVTLRVINLDCSGDNVFTLADCQRESVVFSGGCSSQEAGWAECRKTDEDDFSIRLVGGSREGILEVALNGRWGTVCEDALWSAANAEVACEELGLTSESPPSITPAGNYDLYMSRQKPYWLSGVSCPMSPDTIEDCDHSLVIGYTPCNGANPDSVFNTAEINCGNPIPFRLSGGQIAGIVIGVLLFATLVTLGFIYLPERWKRRHTYPWWVKLTTPRRWCEGVHPRRWCQRLFHRQQRRTATIATVSNDNREYPPATYRTTAEATVSDTESETLAGTEPGPASQDQETARRVERGANVLLGFSTLTSDPQEPQGNLTPAAPPTYQAAVSYPVAAEAPPLAQPPAYTEKTAPYPDPSAAYPPPPNSEGVTVPSGGLPYPPATTLDPAYPPPV